MKIIIIFSNDCCGRISIPMSVVMVGSNRKYRNCCDWGWAAEASFINYSNYNKSICYETFQVCLYRLYREDNIT